MNGPMKSYDEELEMAQAIERVSNLKELAPLHLDLRGYAAYIEEHHIPADQIDESIWSMFRTE